MSFDDLHKAQSFLATLGELRDRFKEHGNYSLSIQSELLKPSAPLMKDLVEVMHNYRSYCYYPEYFPTEPTNPITYMSDELTRHLTVLQDSIEKTPT